MIDPTHNNIQFIETPEGEETLYIDGSQAMQAWERSLMKEAAEILCQYGSSFLEVGLGFGISGLHIAFHANTESHTILELHREVIDMFYRNHPESIDRLRIINADFFDYIPSMPDESVDGIFFDPALALSVWRNETVWKVFVPHIVRVLRTGGAFVPFFSTKPQLREQYVRHFNRVVVKRYPFKAYPGTQYTYGTEGDAYIQCFVKE